MKEEIIILRRCAKFQVQAIFRSRDIGSNGVKRGQKCSFGDFLQNYPSDLVLSSGEERYYDSTYVEFGSFS